MTDQWPTADEDPHALVSQLRIIESQPLAERAAAFSELYEQLQARLGRVDHEG
jgi:hypothetical protein